MEKKIEGSGSNYCFGNCSETGSNYGFRHGFQFKFWEAHESQLSQTD